MDEQEYLKSRLDEQAAWYSARSQAAKQSYQRLRALEIVGAATVPFLAAYADKHVAVQVALGVVGVLLAVGAGLLSLHRYQEQWVEYRAMKEALVREKYFFVTRAAPYDGEQPFTLLVQRAEALMGSESSAWVQATRADRTKADGGA
ncbi:MAG TPA: DUF4231 domain-containing protein [Thermoanaerobaculia bacterium]|jgi:hypothetical protein|nr:DUF4231 domain-containing protein [Thermoanaerobaculia bacterium]